MLGGRWPTKKALGVFHKYSDIPCWKVELLRGQGSNEKEFSTKTKTRPTAKIDDNQAHLELSSFPHLSSSSEGSSIGNETLAMVADRFSQMETRMYHTAHAMLSEHFVEYMYLLSKGRAKALVK